MECCQRWVIYRRTVFGADLTCGYVWLNMFQPADIVLPFFSDIFTSCATAHFKQTPEIGSCPTRLIWYFFWPFLPPATQQEALYQSKVYRLCLYWGFCSWWLHSSGNLDRIKTNQSDGLLCSWLPAEYFNVFFTLIWTEAFLFD